MRALGVPLGSVCAVAVEASAVEADARMGLRCVSVEVALSMHPKQPRTTKCVPCSGFI